MAKAAKLKRKSAKSAIKNWDGGSPVRSTEIFNLINHRQVAVNYSTSFSTRSLMRKSSVLRCAWLVAVLYLVIQVYVLYMNTFHIFAGAPPMCQICAALENYDSASVGGSEAVAATISTFLPPVFIAKQAVFKSIQTHQFPRAPPLKAAFSS